MNTKNRLFLMAAIFWCITCAVAGFTILFLYRAALKTQGDRLTDAAHRVVHMVLADSEAASLNKEGTPDGAAVTAIRNLMPIQLRSLGDTGEILVGRKAGDEIEYLLERRHRDQDIDQHLAFNSKLGEPMRRALSGLVGTCTGLDYRGVTVLAAFQPVPTLGLGVVAKIDLSEIRAPFIKAGLASLAVAFVFILLGSLVFQRITNPMLLTLLHSERKYRQLVETLQDGVWTLDREGNAAFVNPRMAEMLGYDIQEMQGKPFSGFVDERCAGPAKAVLAKGSRGAKERSDLEFRKKNGESLFASVQSSPLSDDAGRPLGMLLSVTDVTPRKKAEDALRYNEEKFRSVIEQSTDGIVLSDADGAVTEWNSGAERITGLRKSAVLGRPFRDLLARIAPEKEQNPGTPERLNSAFFESLLSGNAPWEHLIHENTVLRPDGESRVVQSVVFPIRTPRESMAGIILRDVTDVKRSEAMLNSLLKEKDLLLKEVYHRVKNNFQIVASLLNIQSQQVADPRSVALFHESRDRLRTMSLIHERLYQSGSLDGIDFGEYLRTLAVELFHAYGANPSKVTLRVDAKNVFLQLDAAIPAGLIVNELVTNCLKYAFLPEWEKKGVIEVSLRKTSKGETRLIVADNGRGLPDGLDVRMTQSLGLQLVSMLAEGQLHGKLKVDRKAGTRFTVEFSA
jgi:PAS domain S-box-containing protein